MREKHVIGNHEGREFTIPTKVISVGQACNAMIMREAL